MAFTIHIQGGLCLKLTKHMNEAVSSIVMDRMAFRMYNLLFSRAFSSMNLSNEYIRSMNTIAQKIYNRLAPQMLIYYMYSKKVVPTNRRINKHPKTIISTFNIHTPQFIIFIFSDLQNIEHRRNKCNKLIPKNKIYVFLPLMHSYLNKQFSTCLPNLRIYKPI